MRPRTRYVTTSEGHALAYQVVGEGPVDLLFVPTWMFAVEHLWGEPRIARFFERLAEFSRVILFDRRGTGMSDQPPAATLEEQMDDVRTVVEAAGAERVAVFAQLEAGPMAMLFAATHPDMVQALVLHATFARAMRGEGYEIGENAEERSARVERVLARWGDGGLLDALAPSHAGDATLRDWFGRLQRLSASPGTARTLFGVTGAYDVRDILPSIRVPTLVLHRREATGIDVRHSHYLAEHIPGARLMLLPGADTLLPTRGGDAVLEEIEEFLTGARHAREPDRVLATVLFTDVVGSTERAAAMGDRGWRELLAEHHTAVRRLLRAYGGVEVKTVGDGFLATFDGPARALRAAGAIREAVAGLGLELRAGVHTGEVERVDQGDITGLAVNLAARVMDAAAAGEVLASGTVKDLVVGSGIAFEPRGTRVLRGVPGEWPLWVVRP